MIIDGQNVPCQEWFYRARWRECWLLPCLPVCVDTRIFLCFWVTLHFDHILFCTTQSWSYPVWKCTGNVPCKTELDSRICDKKFDSLRQSVYKYQEMDNARTKSIINLSKRSKKIVAMALQKRIIWSIKIIQKFTLKSLFWFLQSKWKLKNTLTFKYVNTLQYYKVLIVFYRGPIHCILNSFPHISALECK